MYESKNVYPLSARSEKLSSCSFCASSVYNLFGAIYWTRGFPEHIFRINLIEANIVCIIPVKIVKTFPLPPSSLTRVGNRKTGPPEIKLNIKRRARCFNNTRRGLQILIFQILNKRTYTRKLNFSKTRFFCLNELSDS